MAEPGNSEFYVGYQPHAPARQARFLRRSVIALMVSSVLIAVTLAVLQAPFAQAYFEFGRHRVFEGYVSESPYPTLLVRRPAADAGQVPFSRYLLTAPGKYGAEDVVAGLEGARVRLGGTLVYRDDMTMIEVIPGSVEPLQDGSVDSTATRAPVNVGRFTLTGEIVDSKCYLGVMRPGDLKPHRSCAIRCISGGIPPLFVVRDRTGARMQLLMVGEDGRTLNREVLEYVAEPIDLDGQVLRDGALLLLRTEPASFRRRY